MTYYVYTQIFIVFCVAYAYRTVHHVTRSSKNVGELSLASTLEPSLGLSTIVRIAVAFPYRYNNVDSSVQFAPFEKPALVVPSTVGLTASKSFLNQSEMHFHKKTLACTVSARRR